MNRKNTILLAVLMNAGLLVVLFVTALTTQEDLAIAPTHEMSVVQKQEPAPLFGDELDIAMRTPELPQVILEPVNTAVVHALPPAAPAVPVVVEATAPVVAAPTPSTPEIIVKKGDTLEKIAKAQNTTVDEIIKVNHLPSSFLRVGQVLKIPAEKKQIAKAKPVVAETTSDYYTVKVGDNPWTIAMKNHIKVDELLKMNALNEEKARKLKAGDRLRIR